MAEAADLAGSAQNLPTQPSRAYGPVEQADETRQSAQGVLNDVQLDVVFQQVCVRSQALTVDVLGKAWASNTDRREKLFDQLAVSGAK